MFLVARTVVYQSDRWAAYLYHYIFMWVKYPLPHSGAFIRTFYKKTLVTIRTTLQVSWMPCECIVSMAWLRFCNCTIQNPGGVIVKIIRSDLLPYNSILPLFNGATPGPCAAAGSQIASLFVSFSNSLVTLFTRATKLLRFSFSPAKGQEQRIPGVTNKGLPEIRPSV